MNILYYKNGGENLWQLLQEIIDVKHELNAGSVSVTSDLRFVRGVTIGAAPVHHTDSLEEFSQSFENHHNPYAHTIDSTGKISEIVPNQVGVIAT